MKSNILHTSTFVIVLLCGLFLYYPSVHAINSIPVDVWDTDKITSKEICTKFEKELSELADIAKCPMWYKNGTDEKRWNLLKKKIVDELKRVGCFLYVEVSFVTYFRENKKDGIHYIAIDIVEQKDKHKLAYFLPEPMGSIPDPENLIKQWLEYRDKEEALGNHTCHNFSHPRLKKYESIFNDLVPKNKVHLMNILKNDKDYKKRAEVPYLLKHIKNDKELVKILTPFMRDPHYGVRNNVMRAIGEALAKENTIDFPVDEAITALDFPRTSDRNKALYILCSLAGKKILPHILHSTPVSNLSIV